MGGLGVVDSLGASFGTVANALVVASMVSVQVVEGVDGDRIVVTEISDGGGITTNVSLSNVISSLSTKEKVVATNDGISSESWTLNATQSENGWSGTEDTNPEHIERGARVESGLFESSVQNGSLGALFRGQRSGEVKLDTLGNLVFNFDKVAKNVGGRPSLGDGQTVLLISPFRLEIGGNGIGFCVATASDLEGDVRRSLSLNLEGGTLEVVVPTKEVIGSFAKILEARISTGTTVRRWRATHLPGDGDGLRNRHWSGCVWGKVGRHQAVIGKSRGNPWKRPAHINPHKRGQKIRHTIAAARLQQRNAGVLSLLASVNMGLYAVCLLRASHCLLRADLGQG